MEEDIKILEEFLTENRDWKCIECGFNCQNEVKAIENVLKELETYKKIAEKLAEVVDFGMMDFNCGPLCIHDNCIKECALEWARKEVENERNKI